MRLFVYAKKIQQLLVLSARESCKRSSKSVSRALITEPDNHLLRQRVCPLYRSFCFEAY
jgi:hypothetical protein